MPIINYITANATTILAIVGAVGHIFPKKTVARKLSDLLTSTSKTKR